MRLSQDQFNRLEGDANQAHRLRVCGALEAEWPERFAHLSSTQRDQQIDTLCRLCRGLGEDSFGLEPRVYALFTCFDACPRSAGAREVFYRLMTSREQPLRVRLSLAETWLGVPGAR